jgi:hypothetical protein
MTTNIKPPICPFCGEELKLICDDNGYYMWECQTNVYEDNGKTCHNEMMGYYNETNKT